MGSRLLRSNILQPLTDPDTLNGRYDALEELTTKEEMFFATRAGSSIMTARRTDLTHTSFEEIYRCRQDPDCCEATLDFGTIVY